MLLGRVKVILQVMKSQIQVSKMTKLFFMTINKKKKNISHSKLESTKELSYSQLQKAFENLHREFVDAFKKLTSSKQIFSHLEDKVFRNRKEYGSS